MQKILGKNTPTFHQRPLSCKLATVIFNVPGLYTVYMFVQADAVATLNT